MTRLVLCLFLIFPLTANCQQPPSPVPPISFSNPVAPPTPPIPAGRPVQLASNMVYMIYGSVPFQVIDEPMGFVKIEQGDGPVTTFGIFPDGTGVMQKRVYKDKYVTAVMPQKKGTTTLIVVYAGGEPIRQKIIVADGPLPPLPPDPDPDPKPDPKPGVIPAADLRLMMIYETSEKNKLPIGQVAMITGATLRDYMKSKGQYNWVLLDKDQTFADQPDNAIWKSTLAKAGKTALPWYVVFNGKTGVIAYEGVWPADADAMVAKLKKAIGE